MTIGWTLPKYAPIFLVLALSGLIFLLHDYRTLKMLNFSTVFQLKSRTHVAVTADPSPHRQPYCAHMGQEPSPEEALEERHLLASISWPEPPTPLTHMPLSQTSDPAHSLVAILPAGGSRERYMGDQLEALVQIRDFHGRPKRHGGDFLLARLHSPELGAGVAGRVLDHGNGSYSAWFPLLWEGSARVQVTLVHPSEAVAVLQRLRREHPDRVKFKSLFGSWFLSEVTVCNLCLPAGRRPLCDYTDLRSGEPWFCYKPKQLRCDARVNHFMGGYQKDLLTDKEAFLFQSGVNMKVGIHTSGSDTVTVLPEKRDRPVSSVMSEVSSVMSEVSSVMSEVSSVRSEPARVMPSGFYLQGAWRPLGSTPMHQFNNSSAVIQCLKGKVVCMYGDSTIRQWYEYLTAFVPELKTVDLHSPRKVGPFLAVDVAHGIRLSYRCHGPPLAFSTVPAGQLTYVANELDGLAGGPDTVVAIAVCVHFSPFPVEVYIRRLRHIRGAVARLLHRAPGTRVLLRSANLRALNPVVSLNYSDWYALQLDALLRAVFRGLEVQVVDAWEMTVAHHLPHAIHPPHAIIKNMVDAMLSYVCPLGRER